MLSSLGNNAFFVLAMLVFFALILLMEGLFLVWRSYRGPQVRRLDARLRSLAGVRDRTAQTQLLRMHMLSELPALDRALRRIPRALWLDRFIVQSGLNWTVSKLALGVAALGFMTWAGLYLAAHQPLAWSLAAAVLAALSPLAFVSMRRKKRLATIERQLPDTLDLITRAMRAGHAFSSAVKMAGEEMAEPIAAEFATVHDEINFGISMQNALDHLSERVPLTDLRYFVVAVLLQTDSGGNLTEILANLSQLIRARLKLLAKVRVLSSEGRMSAWILGLMPFALAGAMNLVNPTFMSPLWKDPIGIAIVKYMLALMAIGVIVMRRIIKIRV